MEPAKNPGLGLPRTARRIDRALFAVSLNMSGDPEQDYFADGMVEDIITGPPRASKWLSSSRANFELSPTRAARST